MITKISKKLRRQACILHLNFSSQIDYCIEQGPDYADYTKFDLYPGYIDDVELIKKIGKGKFSEVYLGRDVTTGSQVVSKLLKRRKHSKIQREIKVLSDLRGVPYVSQLLHYSQEPSLRTWMLTFEYKGVKPLRMYTGTLTEQEIQYLMQQLLLGVQGAHSRGIFHRDLKPSNIVIHEQKNQVNGLLELEIIDWGISDYIIPGYEYNKKVATRPFKAPEILLGLQDYNEKVDIWAIGCIFAGLVSYYHHFILLLVSV